MIRFGSWSTTLGLAAIYGIVVASLLLFRPRNRVANRFLAAILLVVVLRLMPYVLGFAGFYDVYPWLSFAPFDLGLAIGPLLYLYVLRLTAPTLPSKWPLHFLPAALDLAYTLWAFSLPLNLKTTWNNSWHERFIDPVERWASLVSLSLYLVLSLTSRRQYLSRLAMQVSNREDHRQPWISVILAALGLWLAVAAVMEVAETLGATLTYYDRFPQYLAFSGIVIWLGLEGWRHADHEFPPLSRVPKDVPQGPDWRERGKGWAERIRVGGWWLEPGLSLSEVARKLGTNETYVSKAFNEGLRQNFSAVVNGFRVEAVQARLLQGESDVLALALRSGFSSKASFNRVFREHTGMSPRAWRQTQIQQKCSNTGNETTGSRAEGIVRGS